MNNAEEWLKLLYKLLQFLKEIKTIDLGTALGSGFMGLAYLILVLTINFPIDYLPVIMLLGALIFSGLFRLFFNERKNELEIFSTRRKIAEEKLNFLTQAVKLGLYSATEAQKTTQKIIDEFLLEKDKPTKQKQIKASEEE